MTLAPKIKACDLKVGDRIRLPDGSLADVTGTNTVEKTIPKRKFKFSMLNVTLRGNEDKEAQATIGHQSYVVLPDRKYEVVSRSYPWHLIALNVLKNKWEFFASLGFLFGTAAMYKAGMLDQTELTIFSALGLFMTAAFTVAYLYRK